MHEMHFCFGGVSVNDVFAGDVSVPTGEVESFVVGGKCGESSNIFFFFCCCPGGG